MPAKKRKQKSGRLSSRDLDQVMGAGPVDIERQVARPREELPPDMPKPPEGGPPKDDFKSKKPPDERPIKLPKESPPVKKHDDVPDDEHVEHEDEAENKQPIDKSWVMTDEDWDQVPTEEPVEDPVENEQKFTPEKRDKLKDMSRSIEAFMDYIQDRRPTFQFDPDVAERLNDARSLTPETYRAVEQTFKNILGNMQQTIIAIEQDLKRAEEEQKMVKQREKTVAEDDLIARQGIKNSREVDG